MGTAAFVALLMTLCNKSFSATQFALLSALSAVGRVYVGPVAGWFVESWGWPTFYAFSVVAALPGLILLAGCKNTLERAQSGEDFTPRSHFTSGYRWALKALKTGAALVAAGLILLALRATGWLDAGAAVNLLLQSGMALAVVGIVCGSLLDYLALRRTDLA